MNALDDELMGLVNHVRAHKKRPALKGLPDDADLRGGLGFDSLDLAELTVRIEERFGVDVFAPGIARSWGEIRERVHQHVAGKR